jgi:methionyl-tRNA formyltransferase
VKIIYAGTPDFAVPALDVLVESCHELVAVFTQPDRPAGRGKKLRESPIKQRAISAGIPVFQPETLRQPDSQALVTDLAADVMVVAAYGLILPPAILSSPRYGCINIHASLLPRWRGAAPIQRAILSGDRETGITIMQMAAGLDTGDIILQQSLSISAEDSAAQLHNRLATMSSSSLMEALDLLEKGLVMRSPQDESLVTYASKLEKKEAAIDWSLPAIDIQRAVKAFNSWPVAYTQCSKGTLRVWDSRVGDAVSNKTFFPGTVVQELSAEGIQVMTGEGALWLRRLQLPGGKPLAAREFLNGRSLQGEVLGQSA